MSYRSGINICLFFPKTVVLCQNIKKLPGYFVQQNKKYFTSCSENSAKGSLVKSNIMMKLRDDPNFKLCVTDDVIFLKNLFQENGHEIRIVGGAVRDLLLGKQPQDLDFATTATPTEMKEMFNANDIRLLNMNGEKHGTITARINNRNFEVTTLRVDCVTDGRHATVEFTKNWLLDASRRDLTINALYLDFDGHLYDYFNGYNDLEKRTIRFVGCAEKRIKEDYLRILRYFRFYGKIAQEPDNHCQDILDAIRKNASGLANISGERIWGELNKITLGNFVYEILLKMIELNVGQYIGFPQMCNVEELKIVTDQLKKNQVSVKPITVLTSIFIVADDLENFFTRIKPSLLERNLGYFILTNRNNFDHEKPIRLFQKYIVTSSNRSIAKLISCELLKYKGNLEGLKELENWDVPKFPVNGNALINQGLKGKSLGKVINKLKEIWVDHDFNIDSEKLLLNVPSIVSTLRQQKESK